MNTLLRVVATAVAVAVAALLIPGITVSGATPVAMGITLLCVAAIIGLVNALVKPIVATLSGCLILVTFGLFLFVINAAMLMLASWIAGQLGLGFAVAGFVPALLGSIVISIVSALMNGILGVDRR